jgi:DNA-binding transcriptional ArsR family regulator
LSGIDLPPVAGPDNALAQPTRARLFALLAEWGHPAGTAELAEHLGLHPNGVRTHLDRLQQAGLVVRARPRCRAPSQRSGFNRPSPSARTSGSRCAYATGPYRAAVHENQPAVCALHKGITRGLLDILLPHAKLERFEPHDPDQAGCEIEFQGIQPPTVAPLVKS